MTDNIVSVSIGSDIQLIAERPLNASISRGYLIIRHRHSDSIWHDLRIQRDCPELAVAMETLRRFYLGEPLT